jgi:hypothetical protein
MLMTVSAATKSPCRRDLGAGHNVVVVVVVVGGGYFWLRGYDQPIRMGPEPERTKPAQTASNRSVKNNFGPGLFCHIAA